jgi:hypothetical protein
MGWDSLANLSGDRGHRDRRSDYKDKDDVVATFGVNRHAARGGREGLDSNGPEEKELIVTDMSNLKLLQNALRRIQTISEGDEQRADGMVRPTVDGLVKLLQEHDWIDSMLRGLNDHDTPRYRDWKRSQDQLTALDNGAKVAVRLLELNAEKSALEQDKEAARERKSAKRPVRTRPVVGTDADDQQGPDDPPAAGQMGLLNAPVAQARITRRSAAASRDDVLDEAGDLVQIQPREPNEGPLPPIDPLAGQGR